MSPNELGIEGRERREDFERMLKFEARPRSRGGRVPQGVQRADVQ